MHIGRKGLLVVVEGVDGAGKTTVAKALVERLRRLGYKAEYTYEPYSSPFSEALRKYIDTYGGAEPEIEVLAMALDRVYHVKKLIEPLLKENYIIVCDRYVYSSIAYQGAHGADIEWIRLVNKYAIEPDLAIYLRVPIDVAFERIKLKESRWKYFEDMSRLRRVAEIYEDLVSKGVLIAVDATKTVEEVVNACLDMVLTLLKRLGKEANHKLNT